MPKPIVSIFNVTLVAALVALTASSHADQRVLIWGKTTDREQQSEDMQQLAQSRDRICSTLNDPRINAAFNQARTQLTNVFVELGVPPFVQSEVEESLNEGRDAFCNADLSPDQATASDVFIIYSHCSMFMRQGTGGMSIYLREDLNEAVMIVGDSATGEATKVVMNRDLSRVRQPEPGEPALLGRGQSSAASPSRIGGPREFSLGRGDLLRNYDAYHYKYSYSSSLSGGTMDDMVTDSSEYSGGMTQFPNLAAMTRVETQGNAWMSTEVPGVDIVNTFYDNFARIIEGQQGALSFIGGMLRNQEVITSHGMPLQTTVHTSAAMGTRSTSTFEAKDIQVIPARVDECVARPVPSGYTVTDLNAELASTGSGQPQTMGAGASTQQSDEMAAAMQQAAAAMQQMTPEQRQMMEQFGIGGVAQAPNAAASAAPNAKKCAADLESNNLTQMVQRLLEALEYDPGNTDGELVTETIIAISEFQADKGRKVTGEPSPQLAGILSAEVDKRCGR
jgi:hypothetical protein